MNSPYVVIIRLFLLTLCLKLKKKIHLAFITTTANARLNAIKNVMDNCYVENWILEKVLAQSVENLEEIYTLTAYTQNKWVNTHRRSMSWHKLIKNHLNEVNHGSIEVQVNGYDWGLACNAIHFIDLVSWWLNIKVKTINSNSLDQWFDSKRFGFKDVYGKLFVEYDDSSLLILNSEKKIITSEEIKVKTKSGEIIIEESKNKAKGIGGIELKGRIDFQSDLTTSLADKILNKQGCDLPSLEESIHQHKFLLSALLSHFNEVNHTHENLLPIT